MASLVLLNFVGAALNENAGPCRYELNKSESVLVKMRQNKMFNLLRWDRYIKKLIRFSCFFLNIQLFFKFFMWLFCTEFCSTSVYGTFLEN